MAGTVFFIISVLMVVIFAFVYIKVTPYNEVEAMRKGDVVPLIPLLGAMIAVVACITTAQIVSHNLIETIAVGILMCVAQLIVYLGVERIVFGVDRTNCGTNLAINVLLFVVSLSIATLNIVSMIPY